MRYGFADVFEAGPTSLLAGAIVPLVSNRKKITENGSVLRDKETSRTNC